MAEEKDSRHVETRSHNISSDREALEFEWNIFPGFIFVFADSSRDPEWFAKTQRRTWKIHRLDQLHDNVQRHRLDNERKRWNLYFEFRKSQGRREEILAGTLDVSRSWRRKEVLWNSSLHTWRKWDSAAAQMVERFKDTGLVIQYSRVLVLWVVEFWEEKEWQGHHTLQCGCFEHRALVPNHSFCKSAQYFWSSFELVWTIWSDWEIKATRKHQESVIKGVLTSVKSQEVKLLVSAPRLVSGNCLRENIQDFESLSETIRFTMVCELATIWHRVSAGMSYKTRPDEDDGFGQFISLCREYTLFRGNPQSRAFAAIPGGTILDQSLKILDQCGLEIAIASPNDRQRNIPCYDFQREESVRAWSPYSQHRTQTQCRITHWTSESRRRIILLGTVEDWHPGEWCGPCFKSDEHEGDLCGPPQHFSQPSVFFSHKEPFLRPWGSGQLFLPILRMEELSVNSGLRKCYKNGASLRSRWTTTWRSTSLGHDKASTAEDKGNLDSLGELLWKIRTGSLREKLDESRHAYYVVGHEASERYVVQYVHRWRRFWRRFVNNLKRMIRWNQLVQYQKPYLIGNRSWKSEEDSGKDIQENIH